MNAREVSHVVRNTTSVSPEANAYIGFSLKNKKEGEQHVPDAFLNVLANQGHVNSSGFKTTSLTGSEITI